MGPVVSDIETNHTLNRFRQSSDFSAHILQYMVKRLFTNRVQYPLKLKVFGALWSPFFTIGNWLLTLWPPFLQWCEDRNVNRIGPEYNQSTQKKLHNMRPNFSFSFFLLILQCGNKSRYHRTKFSLYTYQAYQSVFCNLSIYVLFLVKPKDRMTRVRPRFFDQVGHETMCASNGNKHFLTKSCHRQTYQNYEPSQQKLGTILEK